MLPGNWLYKDVNGRALIYQTSSPDCLLVVMSLGKRNFTFLPGESWVNWDLLAILKLLDSDLIWAWPRIRHTTLREFMNSPCLVSMGWLQVVLRDYWEGSRPAGVHSTTPKHTVWYAIQSDQINSRSRWVPWGTAYCVVYSLREGQHSYWQRL